MNNQNSIIDEVKFDDNGLVTAIVLDNDSGDVVMLAYMNRDSLAMTLDKGLMTYWSRSRQKFWTKGEESGNVQELNSLKMDCDGDALLFRVTMKGLGAACHKGYRSCFFRKLEKGQWIFCDERVFNPDDVYGAKNQ